MTRMFTLKKLSFPLMVCLVLHVSLFGQVTSNIEPQKENGFDRKSNFNVEELKVRWKKAALENCTGVPCINFTCGTSTITDINNNTYNTVLIGNQCWTKENLKVTKYNDGTDIRFDASGGTSGNGTGQTWSGSGLDYGAYTVYAHGPSNLSNYGYLYNWYAAKGVEISGSTTFKNLCPTGWHVPTDTDWDVLITELGASSAGNKMKSTSGLWTSPTSSSTAADNLSGFTGLPGGTRFSTGQFNDITNYAFFWSSTENTADNTKAWNRYLYTNYSFVFRYNYLKWSGASIRCLKD